MCEETVSTMTSERSSAAAWPTSSHKFLCNWSADFCTARNAMENFDGIHLQLQHPNSEKPSISAQLSDGEHSRLYDAMFTSLISSPGPVSPRDNTPRLLLCPGYDRRGSVVDIGGTWLDNSSSSTIAPQMMGDGLLWSVSQMIISTSYSHWKIGDYMR